MIFQVSKPVRMQHCDAAGVVFTPQYFNLFVEVIEDWFAGPLDYPFSRMIAEKASGTPAMHIDARFHRPSRMGDVLDFQLSVRRLRKSTALLAITADCAGEKRCRMQFLYGHYALNAGALTPWPEELHRRMAGFLG